MGKGMRAGKKRKPSGGSGDIQKQIQQMQSMQREMEAAQQTISEKEVTTTAGGGAIEVTVSGNKELTKLVIDRDVIDPGDPEMLQDLIIAAVNEAMREVDEIAEAEMNKITGGLNIPGL